MFLADLVGRPELALSLKRPDVPGADLDDGRGRVWLKQVTHASGPTHSGGRLERSVWLRVDGISGTVDQLGRMIVVPLKSLATLAVGRDCRPAGLEFTADAGGPWLRDCSMLPPSEPPLELHRVLLPFGEIGAAGVAVWLDRVERLGPVPAVVADASAAPRRSLEAQVLELTTVA